MQTKKEAYITLTLSEIEKLGTTRSGAAMATYMAVKTFIWRSKRTAYPTRRSIAKRMGNAYSLRAITEAVKVLVQSKLIERIHDPVSNIWFFKLVKANPPKTPITRKKQRYSRRVSDPIETKLSNTNTKKNISRVEATNAWVEETYKTRDLILWWEQQQQNKTPITRQLAKNWPKHKLPTTKPGWLKTSDITSYLASNGVKDIAGSWLFRWWENTFGVKMQNSNLEKGSDILSVLGGEHGTSEVVET